MFLLNRCVLFKIGVLLLKIKKTYNEKTARGPARARTGRTPAERARAARGRFFVVYYFVLKQKRVEFK